MDTVISEKNATEQVDEFFDYYDIDISRKVDEQQTALGIVHADLVTAVMRGRLEMKLDDDEMKVVQHLKKPMGKNKELTEITYGEITGNAKKAGGKLKPTDMEGRTYALLGMLSTLGAPIIAKLRGADLAVAESLGMFFLLL